MSKGWSSYNGLLTKLEKRFSNGMSLRATYTWSHALDLGEGDEGPYSGIRTELKGNMTYDFATGSCSIMVIELPFGKGKHFASGVSGPVDKIIGGWRLPVLPPSRPASGCRSVCPATGPMTAPGEPTVL